MPVRSASTLTLADEAATAAFAGRFADTISSPALIALWGELGAGKTSFARAFIRSLTGNPALDVPSPTFTLAQRYDSAKGPVWHFDLYRLERPEDALELGFDDAVAEGIVLVEWPERLGAHLPQSRIDIRIELMPGHETARSFAVTGDLDRR